jgi:hypothetical protein
VYISYISICNCMCQASPRLRFNKEGSLLAVTASDNGIKILANRDGLQLLRALETTRPFDTNRVAPEPVASKVRFQLSTRFQCSCSSMVYFCVAATSIGLSVP